MKTVAEPPLTLRIAKTLSRSGLRGGGFITRTLLRFGMLNKIVRYQLGSVTYRMPLCRFPFDFQDLAAYEAELVSLFCRAVAPLSDVVLFDCGADIGTFCSLVFARTDRIGRVIAFEPNRDTHEFLHSNLSSLPVPAEIVPKAVSSFAGQGRLESPLDNLTDHARFLVPGDGPIEVTTLDSMNVRGGDIAIKTDLEGGELEALKGATRTISAARHCVVTVEAHPDVARRTGCDPVNCLQFLDTLRPFHFMVAETGERPSLSRPLIRSGQRQIWNVVGWTHDVSL